MTTQLRTDDNNLAGAVSFKGADNIKLTTAGPELLGTPKAPTAAVGNNTTQIATTAFVNAAVQAAGGVVPSDAAPLAATATGVAGSSVAYARGDHSHPWQTATFVPFSPVGTVSSNNVQAAIAEVASEKVAKTGDVMTGPLLVSGTNSYIEVDGGSTGKVQLTSGGGVELRSALPYIDFKVADNQDYVWRIEYESGPGALQFAYSAGKQITFRNDGVVQAQGTRTRAGVSGSPGGNSYNINWSGGNAQLWIDDTNAGNITVTSDACVKKDIVPVDDQPVVMANVLTGFMQLEVVTFQYDNVGFVTDDGITRYGFVAQQVASVFPSIVSGDPNSPYNILTIDPMQMIAVLTKELQALRSEFDAYVASHP